MAKEDILQQAEVVEKVKPAKKSGAAEAVNESVSKLAKFGGFNFLESAVDGIAAMNPERKARKKAFLLEENHKAQRSELRSMINLWIDLLSSSSSINEMLEKAQEKAGTVSQLLSENQLTAVNTVRDLEQSYRNVMLFYKNTEEDKLTNITIVNASHDQITDLDNSRFIDYIANELKQNYDKLDLRKNYSLLVLPGYLGGSKVLDKWSKIAYENKAMLYTDFMDLDRPDDVVDMFFNADLSGGDTFKANTCMACNWLVGRGRYNELGEENDLHVSPAAALAGKVYTTLMSQITAGKKHGGINEVDSVVFPLKKSEISQLDKMGLIPMVNEYGKVMAFSGKTLFNGDNLGLQTYSVVRTFDYIMKVLFDFLNRRAFENWSSKTERDLRGQIIKFLDGVQGPDRLIEKFKIVRFERDPNQKDRIYLDIHITPFFPAKSFVIKLDGTKGEEENTWNTDVEQQ
ncbi:hypothetical protein M2451_003975 [Dysgonomonas sp. PFB1-18]|uniref:DUF5458 family protein n=1 Tax=unclassified Dysgonomonas TaxID=2630389 RepID=UPI0024747DC8|nr:MULTISPECIES: DUF5458 family protein [unclassified Dysgonomonas]MDH6311111.1 hypothetical protein [Dysgonomonas sp. PF1-14]MDH6340971.1 hypothetical protein [Dysgonomonas sp. PF1-16]MDH6382630.1 hypothetical protein [Dysgonomonas sp. PFB1-18]MDH6399977.1 hypothetical protein [Dysgonomonas sp. PF1-23]